NLRIAKHNLWLDDFGAGYSSFNVLKDYSFDVLKIDMKFLDDFGSNERFEPIIGSIINLCRELKMISLAEGVETREQYEFLKKNGCDRMQGYLFSKPLPGDKIVKLFENGTLKA
nr:EAL domain-containing protein [Lachnospiraceae bacterium]